MFSVFSTISNLYPLFRFMMKGSRFNAKNHLDIFENLSIAFKSIGKPSCSFYLNSFLLVIRRFLLAFTKSPINGFIPVLISP